MKQFVVIVNPTADTIKKVETTAKEIKDYNSLKHLIWGDNNDIIIEIVDRKIAGKTFTFVVDDTGLLKDNFRSKAMGINKDGIVSEILAGNVLVCKTKGENLVPLTEEQADAVVASVSRPHEGFVFSDECQGAEFFIKDVNLIYGF